MALGDVPVHHIRKTAALLIHEGAAVDHQHIVAAVDENAHREALALAQAELGIIPAAAAEAIAIAARRSNPQATIHIAVTIEDAVRLSTTLAAQQSRKIYVAGGLFLAIEYAVVAGGGRAQDLDFF